MLALYVSLTWQFASFTRAYNSTPTVLVSANHSTTVSGNSAPIHYGITTWIEVKIFRHCGELYRDACWQTRGSGWGEGGGGGGPMAVGS